MLDKIDNNFSNVIEATISTEVIVMLIKEDMIKEVKYVIQIIL
jgi:hypothetical protein